jgi:hypothetical protein
LFVVNPETGAVIDELTKAETDLSSLKAAAATITGNPNLIAWRESRPGGWGSWARSKRKHVERQNTPSREYDQDSEGYLWNSAWEQRR